ncbi:MAG TPA: response regulator transcription factor [Candidatus Gallimonas intestinigallinarum]|uniref:Stage 0 sporulation protein A homolog n=1 Tax=Candidatus Gallimonas intestinigallinarum TaxID=2838604 RepID=A0A9D2DVR0_9FIRM|nr:response regulator transcription factor [Candidatus Gallimonas intestinigallinarum]
MRQSILVIEDDSDINDLLKRILSGAGYDVLQSYSWTEALLLLKTATPDLILSDLMLPGMSGEQVFAKLRGEPGSDIPVIILSAKDGITDKVGLLDGGADDYITKPFAPDEVLARVRVVLRRRKKSAPEEALVCKNIAVYPELRRVEVCGQELTLTAIEFDLLLTLMRSPGKVFSRERLYEEVWKDGYYGTDHTVNVHVSNLRKKLKEADPDEEYIQSVYGIGFRLVKS